MDRTLLKILSEEAALKRHSNRTVEYGAIYDILTATANAVNTYLNENDAVPAWSVTNAVYNAFDRLNISYPRSSTFTNLGNTSRNHHLLNHGIIKNMILADAVSLLVKGKEEKGKLILHCQSERAIGNGFHQFSKSTIYFKTEEGLMNYIAPRITKLENGKEHKTIIRPGEAHYIYNINL